MNYSKAQQEAIIKYRDLVENYGLCISSEDPYCGVDVQFNCEKCDYLFLPAYSPEELNAIIESFNHES